MLTVTKHWIFSIPSALLPCSDKEIVIHAKSNHLQQGIEDVYVCDFVWFTSASSKLQYLICVSWFLSSPFLLDDKRRNDKRVGERAGRLVENKINVNSLWLFSVWSDYDVSENGIQG